MRVPDHCEHWTQCVSPSNCVCVNIVWCEPNTTVIRIRIRSISIYSSLNGTRFQLVMLLMHIVMHIQYDYLFRSFSCTFYFVLGAISFRFKYFSIETFIAIINGHNVVSVFSSSHFEFVHFFKHRFYDAQCSFYEFFSSSSFVSSLFHSFSFIFTPEKSQIWVKKTLLNEK